MRPLCLRPDERLHSRNDMRGQGGTSQGNHWLKMVTPAVSSPSMKNAIVFTLLLVVAQTMNAQGTLEAMPNYAGTGSSGGSPVSSSIYAAINGPIGWTFQPTTAINVTALGAFDYLMPSPG